MAKTYFFYCRCCNLRKPQSEESFFRPGYCKACYKKRHEIDAEFVEDRATPVEKTGEHLDPV